MGLIKLVVSTIDIKIKNYDPFFNINTKEDLEVAQTILNLDKND